MQESFISYDNGRTYRRHMIPDEDDMIIYLVTAWARKQVQKLVWRERHPVKYWLLRMSVYFVTVAISAILTLTGVF